MNHTYKHIWSKTLGRLVIVPECCKGGQGRKGGKATLGAAAMVAATLLAGPARAQSVLPTGGTVTSGAASIATNGAAMTINQSSDKMIANWQSFSIGAGNSVTFNQPGASSVALNRVTGQDASQILGSLTANGQVFLVNPNGIAIGKTGSVQTGAFVASTLGISDANFLAGNYRFTGTSGTVTNEGNVSGKTVALISPVVSNSGTITGNTALAAGTDVQLDFNGDGLLSVEVKASTMATLVENKGLIKADGGVAILTAKGASAAMKGVVNNTGTIEANSIGTKNGRILLLGDMQNGEVKAAGKLKAKFVETSAAKVTIDKDLKVETQGGKWLIDPTDIVVDSSNVDAYVNALSSGTSIEIATPSAGSQPGDIAINAAMSWSSSSVLTLTANNNIAINAAISAASGGLTINATGSITATAGISLGTFVLNSGSWQQNAATLPSFYAKDFQLNGGSFLRVTGGDGTSATPYLLADIYGVQGIGSSAGYLAASWKLVNDIDASGTANWKGGAGFNSIGPTSGFTGTLDGDNHVIAHLSILAPLGNAGLFAQVGNAGMVKNLGITDATVSSSYTAGILAGGNDGTVTNVWTSGTVSSAGLNSVGGLVGANSGTISGSRSSATVSHAPGRIYDGTLDSVGGLVGYNSGTISQSYASGPVNGGDESYTGGLVGFSNGGSISYSYATGAVSASTNSRIGGLVGKQDRDFFSGVNAEVSFSYATGTVTGINGTSGVGGLVGSNDSGTISNSYSTGVITGDIVGFAPYGGLVGRNAGTISYSYATGAVSAGDRAYVGGLVGTNAGVGIIEYSYATGAVVGRDFAYVGGLVGYDLGRISDSYASGALSVGSSARVNGLVGSKGNGTITNSFWDTETTGQTIGCGGLGCTAIGLTTAQMRSAASYTGWDFTNVWYQSGDMRPILRSEAATADSNGVITISNLHQLALMGANPAGNYKLAVDLDASATKGLNASDIWGAGGWVPVGNGSSEFTGTFDGQNHTIANLTINRPTEDAIGLFGATNDASIANIGLIGGSVSGGRYTGGLVGNLGGGTVSNAYNTGTVSGTSYVGGLIGASANGINFTAPYNAMISNVHATGDISGTNFVGGLIGYIILGDVRNAYATGAVTGDTGVGGLVGYLGLAASLTNSYASGAVSGNSSVGGLVGMVGSASVVTNSFWNTTTSGQSSGCGTVTGTGVCTATGLTTAQMADPFKYIDAGWDFASTWASLKAGGAPVLRSFTTDPVYTYYVRLTGDTTTTYGDTIDTSAIAVDGVGAGNVGVSWGSAVGSMPNAGTYAYNASNVVSLSYSAGAAGDYYVDYGSSSLTVGKRVVSLTGTRTYDGTTDVGAGILTLGNLVSGETLTLTGIGQLSGKNVGTSLGFGLGTLALGNGAGGLASNYTLTGSSRSVDITKAVITSITDITATNKTYDATTAASLVLSGATFNGMVSGDVLTVATAAGAFRNKNAGAGKTVDITGLTLGGTDAGNYTLSSTTASTTADIAKAMITSIAGITADNKTYDGSDAASLVLTGATLNGKIAGDVLTVASAAGAFSGKDVGNGLTVGISGLTLGGTDAGNYTLSSTTASTTANIVQRVLSLSGGRVYDGTEDVAAGVLTLGNLVSGETLVLSGTGQLADKNAGAGRSFSLGTLALGNGSGTASNYTLAGGTTTVDIAKAMLTLSGFTAANKTYDGTTTASILSAGTLLGAISGDNVSFVTTGANFADKNAGTGKTVTLNGVLNGSDAGNYTLASGTVTTTADISRAVITAISGITALSKPYDGNTTAALVYSGAVFNGMVAGDLLSIASGTGAFADSNSGTGKLVNITGLSLGGFDARNYTLASATATTTADINASVAPVLPPPNTIDTGTAAINGIGSTVRASFVVTTQDAFAQPVLIDVAPPVNVASDTRSETRKRWDDDQ